jgi:methyltransferase family protein
MSDSKIVSPSGLDNRFRERRFALFSQVVGEILSAKATCSILDIGGSSSYWARYGGGLDWTRVRVCSVNVEAEQDDLPRVTSVVGDARKLDQFADNSFDLVHSNSVIEHVGKWGDMVAMAEEVRRLAPRYFVQTPYFWFPVEPHARTLFLHWIPESWRYRIILKRQCGYWERQPDVGMAVEQIQSAAMLDKRQMMFLFPDATITFERFLGLPKSMIAVR